MTIPALNIPELKISVFSDYTCPFCYVGHHRLQHLHDSYDLKINWCFLEIHPEISADGEPIDSLQYSSEQWQQMVANLERVANEENIPLSKLSFTTNSKDALLLSEAVKESGAEVFYDLHEKLFAAYFVDGDNIGDRNVLKKIANTCGIDNKTIESAWSEKKYAQRLLENFNAARKYKIQSVPSFVFGKHVLTGVATEEKFRAAALQMIKKSDD